MKDALAPAPSLGPFAQADEPLQRLAIGLAVSLFVHLLILIGTAILLAGSQGEADYVTISIGDAATPTEDDSREVKQLEEATQRVEPPRPQENQEVPLAVDVSEKTERIAQALSET